MVSEEVLMKSLEAKAYTIISQALADDKRIRALAIEMMVTQTIILGLSPMEAQRRATTILTGALRRWADAYEDALVKMAKGGPPP